LRIAPRHDLKPIGKAIRIDIARCIKRSAIRAGRPRRTHGALWARRAEALASPVALLVDHQPLANAHRARVDVFPRHVLRVHGPPCLLGPLRPQRRAHQHARRHLAAIAQRNPKIKRVFHTRHVAKRRVPTQLHDKDPVDHRHIRK
jgi:hypothetical protein